jgi:hypothetical protein
LASRSQGRLDRRGSRCDLIRLLDVLDDIPALARRNGCDYLLAVGRGLVIAQDSSNRAGASVLASPLALLEAEHGDTASAFDHLTLAIRNFHNAGDTTTIRVPLAILAVLFDRLGRYEPAATIAGFALSPMAAAGVPEITTAITHLRDVLGDQVYESLARKGETMTTAAMATYAYDQIDQARTTLEHPS